MPDTKDVPVEAPKTEDIEARLEKGEELTPEEEEAYLKEQPPTDGYDKFDVEDIDPNEMDQEGEANPEDEEKKEAEKPEKKEEPNPEGGEEGKESSELEDPFVKIERELAKSEDKADLTQFSDREKAYYHQMRRDRKSRQKAERERDEAIAKAEQLKVNPEPKNNKVLEDLKQKNPDDYMSVKDVLAILESQEEAEKSQADKPKDTEQPAGQQDPFVAQFLKMSDSEARRQFSEDYDYVMELTEELIVNNPKYLQEIQSAVLSGENPAVKTYHLIKSDPAFSDLLPAAKVRVDVRKGAPAKAGDKEKAEPDPSSDKGEKKEKSPEETAKEKEAEAAQKALEANKNKTRTTASVDSIADKPLNEITAQDVANMSDREFARLPKKTQDWIMRTYG